MNAADGALLGLAILLTIALTALVVWLSVAQARTPRQYDATRRPSESGAARWSSRIRGGRPPRSAFGGNSSAPQVRRAAIIVNPSKFTNVAQVQRTVFRVCREYGWAEPLWLETSVEDPGVGQTQQALDAGVDLVCALGGDGTVRTVGATLVGTGTPLGLLPGGTGNLLARNLGLPADLSHTLRTALTGRNTRIDTCQLTLTRPTEGELEDRSGDDEPSENVDPAEGTDPPVVEEHVFLVMAGLGFDAEVMAGAPEQLKARVGWPAYLVSGARHLRGPQFVVTVTTDDGIRLKRRVRSVVVGNVGKLQGGMVLLPEARSDDGVMDAVLLSPQGLVGWGAVVARLATRRRKGHQRVDFYRCRDITVTATKPVELQVDGDTLGPATEISVAVDPASLVVRLPA